MYASNRSPCDWISEVKQSVGRRSLGQRTSRRFLKSNQSLYPLAWGSMLVSTAPSAPCTSHMGNSHRPLSVSLTWQGPAGEQESKMSGQAGRWAAGGRIGAAQGECMRSRAEDCRLRSRQAEARTAHPCPGRSAGAGRSPSSRATAACSRRARSRWGRAPGWTSRRGSLEGEAEGWEGRGEKGTRWGQQTATGSVSAQGPAARGPAPFCCRMRRWSMLCTR